MKLEDERNRENFLLKQQMLEIGWAKLPRVVMCLKNMSWNAKGVYLAILDRIQERGGGRCFPSIPTISEDTGIPIRTVGSSLKSLREMKLIRSERVGLPARNQYFLRPIPEEIIEQYLDLKSGRNSRYCEAESASEEERREKDILFLRKRSQPKLSVQHQVRRLEKDADRRRKDKGMGISEEEDD